MAKLLPEEAVARCGRRVAWNKRNPGAEPYADIKLGKNGAFWSGVQTCGSLWQCPCCAAAIAAERRMEVRAAIDRHEAEKGATFMATFTMPHHAFQSCRELVRAVAASFSKTIAGAPWLRAKDATGLIGYIRSLEITHGANGWHPHLHVLLLLSGARMGTDDVDERGRYLSRFLFARWSRQISLRGFGECSEAAWSFQRAITPDQAGDYVSKWGPDWELTHAHLKDGRNGGRSPWRILRDYHERNDPHDAALLRDYAFALKGARQLTWSKGLKESYRVNERKDAEIAAAIDDKARTIVRVHQDALSIIFKYGAAIRTLEVAESGGVAALLKFFALLHIDSTLIQIT